MHNDLRGARARYVPLPSFPNQLLCVRSGLTADGMDSGQVGVFPGVLFGNPASAGCFGHFCVPIKTKGLGCQWR